MQAKRILTTAALVVAAMFILGGTVAYADTSWQAVSSVWDGNWADSAHWTAGVPDSSDIVTFPTGSGAYVVTFNANGGASSDTGYAKQFDMHADCTLNIPSSKFLEIGSANGETSSVDGDIVLQTSSSVLRIMFNHTMQAKSAGNTGRIIGQNSGAVIDDNTTTARTLTIQDGSGVAMSIEGMLKIQLSLVNNSVVLANASGILLLDSGTYTGTTGVGVYEVNGSGATMKFDDDITAGAVGANFSVSLGTLHIVTDSNVTSAGELTFDGGTIQVESGESFSISA